MRLGIYLNSQHPTSDDPARCLAETLEQVRLIRSLDFDSIWAGEHHVTPGFHFFPQFALLQRAAPVAIAPPSDPCRWASGGSYQAGRQDRRWLGVSTDPHARSDRAADVAIQVHPILVPGGPTDTPMISDQAGWPREKMLRPGIM